MKEKKNEKRKKKIIKSKKKYQNWEWCKIKTNKNQLNLCTWKERRDVWFVTTNFILLFNLEYSDLRKREVKTKQDEMKKRKKETKQTIESLSLRQSNYPM